MCGGAIAGSPTSSERTYKMCHDNPDGRVEETGKRYFLMVNQSKNNTVADSVQMVYGRNLFRFGYIDKKAKKICYGNSGSLYDTRRWPNRLCELGRDGACRVGGGPAERVARDCQVNIPSFSKRIS